MPAVQSANSLQNSMTVRSTKLVARRRDAAPDGGVQDDKDDPQNLILTRHDPLPRTAQPRVSETAGYRNASSLFPNIFKHPGP